MKSVKSSLAAVGKEITVLLNYSQSSGSNNLPLNILKRSLITYYLINYSLHKHYYDFYDVKKTVNDFILSVKNKFISSG